MTRIYPNENFYKSIVRNLREKGHDVLTSFEAGNANQGIPDENVFEFAQSERRVILTLNRGHFIRIHRRNPIHFGIIICTEDTNREALANRIHQALEEADYNIENQLVSIIKPNPSKKGS